MKLDIQLDSECLVKLGCIFTKILGNNFPRDDTFIENLVTLCQSFIRTNDACVQFVKETLLLDLIQEACTTDINPHSYAFFLRLFTLVTKGGFLDEAFHTHIKLFARINNFKHDASVRFAWTESCSSLGVHESFRTLLLSQPGFYNHLESLCRDPSLFVMEKAHELVGHLILLLHHSDPEKSRNLVDLFIAKPLKESEQINTGVLIMKSVLLRNASSAFPVIKDYITLVISTACVKTFHLRKTWMEIFAVLVEKSVLTEEQITKLCKLPAELMQLAMPEVAIELAAWIMMRMNTAGTELENILTGPIHEYCEAPASYKHHHMLLKSIHLMQCMRSKNAAVELLARVLKSVESSHHSSPKLTAACLESCRGLISEATETSRLEVLQLSITFLQNMESQYLVIQQALQTVHAALCELCKVPSPGTIPYDVLSDLASTVSRRLCDLRWEVRDSAAEFVGTLTQGVVKDSPALTVWLCNSDLISGLVHSCRDAHSYVRATAMYSLAHVVTILDAWKTLDKPQAEKLVEHVMNTALTDTEAFPRRAAVHFLFKLHEHDLHPADDIFKVIRKLAHDFDWEVKLKVLEFWKSEMETLKKESETVNGKKRKLSWNGSQLGRLISIGCCDFLRVTLNDEDRSVQLAVCKVLKEMKENFSLEMKPELDVLLSKPDIKKQKLEPSMNKADSPESLKPLPVYTDELETKRDTSVTNPVESQNFVNQTAETFLAWLLNQDLDKLEMESSQSINQYSDNPGSFLDDVLGSLCGKVEVCDQNDVDQAGAVDCY